MGTRKKSLSLKKSDMVLRVLDVKSAFSGLMVTILLSVWYGYNPAWQHTFWDSGSQNT